MVNVPGRSKGCKTCRMRKLRCSLELPECFKCIKSGRICLGYERQRIFVNSNVGVEATKEKIRHRVKDTVTKQYDAKLERKRKASRSESPKENEIVISEPIEDVMDLHGSRSLVYISLRQQMLASYVGQYENTSPCGEPDGCTWITAIPSILNPSKALEIAAYALSLARASASLKSRDMEQESLKLYTEGLHYFQLALWDPKLMYSDETLAACVLLTMYEVFQCPGNSGKAYTSHHKGCARLIQLRGPAAHADGLGHSIFQWFRFMGTLEAMRSKSTFLSRDEWKTEPFSVYPKSLFQKMLDFLLEAPSILSRVDDLKTLPESNRTWFAVELLQDCLQVESGIQELSNYLKGGCRYRQTSSCSSMSQYDDLPLTPDHISNVRTDTTTILSWAGLTVFWSGICHLYQLVGCLTKLTPTETGTLTGQFIANGVTKQFSLPNVHDFMGFPTMARKVYQSVGLYMEDELGLILLVCPLHMIIEALSSWPGHENDIAQAKDLLSYIQEKGMKIVQYHS